MPPKKRPVRTESTILLTCPSCDSPLHANLITTLVVTTFNQTPASTVDGIKVEEVEKRATSVLKQLRSDKFFDEDPPVPTSSDYHKSQLSTLAKTPSKRSRKSDDTLRTGSSPDDESQDFNRDKLMAATDKLPLKRTTLPPKKKNRKKPKLPEIFTQRDDDLDITSYSTSSSSSSSESETQ